MNRFFLCGLAAFVAVFHQAQAQTTDTDSHRGLLDKYCVTCHNETLKTANLLLDKANLTDVADDPELWERVITKLTLRAMPPVGMPLRPSEDEYASLLDYLISELDGIAQAEPDPGRPTIHRLNRTEYSNAVRDLLALEINSEELLPPDNLGGGFDNIAEFLAISPVLMERYMFAASRISSLAVGFGTSNPRSVTYTIPASYRQNARMSEDLPFRSRGGMAVRHHFPQDGEYTIKVDLYTNQEGYIRGLREKHVLDFRLDHKRLGTLTVGGEFHGRPGPLFTGRQDPLHAGDLEQIDYEFTADNELQIRFTAKAGMHLVGVAFVDDNTKPDGISQPELVLADIGAYKGGEPTIENVIITGPFDAKGSGTTASRQKIFICRPDSPADQACARKILSRLARQAYRRPVGDDEVDELLKLFQQGQRQDEDFDSGIELALQRILTGPEFLFRIEKDPDGLAPGDVHPVSDIELASRLSFFLWSSIPDEELVNIAGQGRLRDPGVLKQQVKRMMADARFDAFIHNFGRQWLGVRDLDNSEPNQQIFLRFDNELREAFRQELMLWFESMVREDRSVLEILDSDYTFVNERLARHYGIADIYGSRFRPVRLSGYEERLGLFGKGGMLLATAFNNRTSPVVRGKWVLENLLNMPPPPPPDDVPALQVEDDSGKALTLKQAMEKHRANPVCSSCHKLMDPIGFALENFDAVGAYRTRYDEADADVDASGILFDGSEFSTTEQFRSELMKHSGRIAHTVTEKVLTYALGRELEYYDQPAVRRIVEKTAPDDHTWSSLILAVIESTPFQNRRVNK